MTSPVDTTVKVFHSEMAGAPVLTGAAGSLIALLDACLVNGFGAKTLTSLVVSGGVATAAFSGTHPAMADAVVTIAGASPAGLNGDHKVLSAGTGTVTFSVTEADTTATGTMTMKLASAGWEKRFTGTNLAVYRSLDMTGLRFNLRVSDTALYDARIVGYETMSAVSTGTGPFPTTAQQSGGLYLHKAYNDSVTAIPWVIFANGKRFYICNAPMQVPTYSPLYTSMLINGFGEFPSLKSSVDSYAGLITGATTPVSWHQVFGFLGIGNNMYFARASSGAGSAIQGRLVSGTQSAPGYASGESSVQGELPGITGKLRVHNPLLSESDVNTSGAGVRGYLNELFHTPQGITQAMNLRKLDRVPSSGRNLLVIPASAAPADPLVSSYIPATFIDVTGPWE